MQCAGCGKEVEESEFEDETSLREWQISRWCQVCQDNFFGKKRDK
jgi:hypothetical protein